MERTSHKHNITVRVIEQNVYMGRVSVVTVQALLYHNYMYVNIEHHGRRTFLLKIHAGRGRKAVGILILSCKPWTTHICNR